MQLTDAQRRDWLRLIRSESVGPRTFQALVTRFGGAAAALDALPDLARQRGRSGLKVTTCEAAEREMAVAARCGARFVALGEADYPKPLQAIQDAPPLIAVRGSAAALSRPMIAIVGSRNASAAGLTFAGRLARELGEGGCAIVSGLARGIDTSAHKASLDTGAVAVLAGGLDRVYPPENKVLAERIVEQGGCIVSEMPFGWTPRGIDFPRRNRIVSGMAYGVVVVEAARRSGSLITARCALDQGREVFAVPGSPLDPRAEGANDLIRAGATLCTAAEDVLSALAPLTRDDPSERFRISEPDPAQADLFWDELSPNRLDGPAPDLEEISSPTASSHPPGTAAADGTSTLVALLGPAPVAVDDLCRQADLPIRLVQQVLLELELTGRLERRGGNMVALIR